MNLEEIRSASFGGPIAVFEVDERLRYVWFRYLDVPVAPGSPMAGKCNRDVFPIGIAAEADRLIEKVLDTGVAVRSEVTDAGTDGTTCFELFLEPLLGNSGTPVGVTCAAINVTRCRQLALQLARSSQLSAVGILAAGIAHEMSTPLTYVVTNLQTAMSDLTQADTDTASQQRLARCLSDALDGATRVAQFVRDLRTCTRPDLHEPKLIDLRAALEPACRMAGSRVGAQVTFDVQWDPVPPVRASPVGIGQVAINLLLNAAQAVRIRDSTRNRIRLATSTRADGWACFTVTDTGHGIDPAIRGRIFEAFFTTRLEDGGSGLGLWLCERIVASHGGEITCQSEPGRGSQFCVALPPAASPALSPASSPK